ncbi:MAG: DUF1553 domain-containing protein [Pirellulaceae bacterium]|nr:DUF1553 domain-containing protein [Pirellulaceae bacterium]
MRTFYIAFSLPVFGLAVAAATAGEIDFNRDIRPILSDNCFRCHGPDESERQANYRLDVKAVAFGELEGGGRGIVAGDRAASKLLARITTGDTDQQMPPPDSGKVLTRAQIELLHRWIESGATWEEHWSFVAPVRPPLPDIGRSEWTRNPIDSYVLAQIESAGESPSREADQRALIRRLTFDLTGLPPTPSEVNTFLQNSAPDAYERLVDRLLDSPRYGEHQARYWMDAARYGDTHGLHLDNERSIWPYRDWVIDAFNQNMSFDQFTVEQLAGDLLPDATLAQRVATGFNRCNVSTSEGGSIDQEYLVRYATDRVETTATVWMGLTAGCAACHDHKFDPLTQREFYQLFAFFFSQTERAMDGNALLPPPSVKTASITQRVKLKRLEQLRNETRGELKKLRDESDKHLAAWADEYRKSAEMPSLPEGAIVRATFDENEGDRVDLGQDRSGQIVGTVIWDAGKQNSGLRFDGNTHVDLGDVAAFDKGDAFSGGAWIYPTGKGALTLLSRMADDKAFQGYDIYLGNNQVFVHLIHHWEKDAIRVNTKRKLTLSSWQHVFVTYDGSGTAAGVHVYVDGQEEELQVTHDRLRGSISTDATLKIGRRTPSAPFQGIVDEVRIYPRVLTDSEIEALVGANPLVELLAETESDWSSSERQQLLDRFLKRREANYRELADGERQQADQIRRIESSFASTLVMQEMSKPRAAHLLIRGQYDQPGESVGPGVPAILPAMSAAMRSNRLGLARWLTSPTHPLTARVTVNRIWQQHFGIGLVKTTEDFGSQGQWPSHPELLDWLAVELVDSGWDVKAMHRQIVNSATYRQASIASSAAYRRDPENRLLARGPRFRMDAEMIRDNALAISGLLVEQTGGKSVKPYQPLGLWKAVGYTSSNTAQFKASEGASLYRRSLYSFWKRTSPPPGMQIFDAPSREVCTVRRPRTNTPAAALVLMNDPQYVEAARELAGRMITVAGSDVERIRYGLLLVASRPPAADEVQVLQQMLVRYREKYEQDPEAAKQLVSVGASNYDKAIAVNELAAWTLIASTLLNLDETITK